MFPIYTRGKKKADIRTFSENDTSLRVADLL